MSTNISFKNITIRDEGDEHEGPTTCSKQNKQSRSKLHPDIQILRQAGWGHMRSDRVGWDRTTSAQNRSRTDDDVIYICWCLCV